MTLPGKTWIHALAALGVVSLATICKAVIDKTSGIDSVFAFYMLSAALCSWRFGRFAGFLAVALSTLAYNFYFMPPPLHFGFDTPQSALQLLLFVSVALLIVETMRRAVLAEHHARNASVERLRAQESERRFTHALDSLTDPTTVFVAVRDQGGKISDFRVEYLNDAAALSSRLAELPRPAQVGQTLRDIFPDIPGAGVFDDCVRVVETGEPLDREFRVNADINHPEWLEIRAARVGDGLILQWRDTSRKHAYTDALQLSEMRYRSLVQATSLISWTTDAQGSFVSEQPAWTEFTGQRFDQFKGWGWAHAIHPDDRDRMLEAWKQSLESRTIFEQQGRYRRVDGEYRDMLVRGVPILDASGDVIEWVGTHTDITERVQSEIALRGSEARFRIMADAAPVLIWMSGTDKLCTWFNKLWLDFVGRSIEEELGNGWAENVHPQDIDRCLSIYSAAFDARQTFSMEYRLRRHDGEYRWVLDSAVPLYAADGEFTGYIGSCFDITDRRQTEQELRQSHDTFLNLIQNAPFGVYLVDSEFRLVQASVGSRKVFSNVHPLIGRDFAEVLRIVWAEPFADEAIARFRHTLETGEPYRAPDTTEKRADVGEVESYDWQIERVTLPDGRFGVVCYFYDMTARRLAEQALRESQARLLEFTETLEERVRERTIELEERSQQLRGLAMDLSETESRERKRLAQMLHDHFQQLISAAKLKAGVVRRALREHPLLDSMRQIESLLEDAITASRSLATELSPPVLNDAGLFAAFEWLVRKVEKDYNLRVALHFQEDAEPESEQVRTLIFECVRELLFNIVKHAHTHEASLIVRRTDDGLLSVVISDQGRGFDPQKTEGKTQASFGLFSIRERLTMIGGLLNIRSQPGAGTRVELTVPVGIAPVKPPSAALEPVTRFRPLKAGNGPARVLVADDHRLFREGLIQMLAQEKSLSIVGEASDGAEAVELCRQLKPDVLILDVSMPKLNGIQVAKQLSRELPDIRIIGLSMHERADMADAMRDAGACAYLTKGGPCDQLVGLLRSLTSQPVDEEPFSPLPATATRE